MERLPAPCGIGCDGGEPAFPVAHPTVQGQTFRMPRGAEKVQMVRHKDITADDPGFGFTPCGQQGLLDGILGDPPGAVVAGDGDEDEGGFGKGDPDPARGFLGAGRIHGVGGGKKVG